MIRNLHATEKLCAHYATQPELELRVYVQVTSTAFTATVQVTSTAFTAS